MIVRIAIALSLAGCLSEPGRKCSTAHQVEGLHSAGFDIVPSLSPDRHELWFTSDRGASYSVYHAHRDGIEGAFDAPVLLDNPENTFDTFDAVLSADGNKLWYVKGDGNNGGDVYEATRDGSTRGWTGDHQVFSNLGSILHPSLTANELFIYYAVRNGGPTGTAYHDIWTASRGSTDVEFGEAMPVAVSTDAADEFDPSISPDNSVLLYSTNGVTDLPGEHIMKATRLDNYGDSKLVEDVAPAADNNDDMGAYHADGQTFVFSTSRDGGGQQIWIACE